MHQNLTGIITAPIHIGDFLSDTIHMDATETGAYIMLIFAHMQSGGTGLEDNDKFLSRISKVSMKVWLRIRPVLEKKFIISDGFWRSSNVIDVLQKVHDKSSKQRAKALKKHGSRHATAEPRHSQPKPKEYTDVYSPPIPPNFFDEWYKLYPHKVGKADARKKFEIAIKKTTFENLLYGLEKYIQNKPPDRPWCNPATWLHQERWDDQPENVTIKGNNHGKQELTSLEICLAVAAEYDEQERTNLNAGQPKLQYIQ